MEKLMQVEVEEPTVAAAKPPPPKPPHNNAAFQILVPPQLEEPLSAVADHDPSAVSETAEAVNVMPPNQGAPVKHKDPPLLL